MTIAIEQLAMSVAGDVSPELAKATDAVLSGEAVAKERLFGLGLGDALAAGSFLVTCAGFALEYWKTRQDKELLLLAIAAAIDSRKQLEPEVVDEVGVISGSQRMQLLEGRFPLEERLSLLGRVADKLGGRTVERSPTLQKYCKEGELTRGDWASRLSAALGVTGMSQPILMPFLEMKNWAVYGQPVVWNAPTDAPVRVPRSVCVPKGFVTDLASIPDFFCWVLSPVGKHAHAAIVHDWLYWEQPSGVDRAVADQVFLIGLEQCGVPATLRYIMWAAVRVYGGNFWQVNSGAKILGEKRVLSKYPGSPVSWDDWKKQSDVFAD